MPCRECGRSAKQDGGLCVGLSYDEDGTARYWCIECVKEKLTNPT